MIRQIILLGCQFAEKTNCKLQNFFHKIRLYNLQSAAKTIGNNVKIGKRFQIGHPERLVIEDFVNVGNDVFINADGGVTIQSGCVLGPNVTIFSVNHIVSGSKTLPFDNTNQYKPVIIGNNCWIGAHTFITPGVSIGEGSVVAGGSVVTKSFPSCSLIGGNPAKLIRQLDADDYNIRKTNGKYCNWIIN